MNQPTFEYCAVRFLDNWIKKEKILSDEISAQTPTLDGIRNSLAYFKVSRGFAGIKNDLRIQRKVQSLIVKHSRNLTVNTTINRVESLAFAFKSELELGTLLSAASKLLWLRNRSPVVIYDRRALQALNRLGHNLQKSAYEPYYSAWQETFSNHRREIVAASNAVPSIIKFTAAYNHSKTQIKELVKNEWFLERVLDQYLWLVGE